MKAKVFRVAGGPDGMQSLVLEFRRYFGNAVAFGHVFRQASFYMAKCPGEEPSGGLEEFAMPPAAELAAPPAIDVQGSVGGLQPLKDMLNNHSSPQMQAEAAAALAALRVAPAILRPALAELQDTLAVLLASSRIEIAYPVALLVAALASCHHNELYGPALLSEPLHAAVESILVEADPLVRGALDMIGRIQ